MYNFKSFILYRLGENCKAAIIRLGLQEIKHFIKLLIKETFNEQVLWEPCGFSDLIATCYGGKTRTVVEKFVTSNKVLSVKQVTLISS